jgi:hypothetical protein
MMFRWFRRTPSTQQTTVPAFPKARPILNADLTESDLPADDADFSAWEGIPSFAASFNGYQFWGSFEKCFEVNRRVKSQGVQSATLTELRTALFCQYRSFCHDGEATAYDVSRSREIIAEIRDRIRRRAIE